MNTNAGGTYVGEVAATPDLDDVAMLQCDNYSATGTDEEAIELYRVEIWQSLYWFLTSKRS